MNTETVKTQEHEPFDAIEKGALIACVLYLLLVFAGMYYDLVQNPYRTAHEREIDAMMEYIHRHNCSYQGGETASYECGHENKKYVMTPGKLEKVALVEAGIL